MKKTAVKSASALIDARIEELGDWRGKMLAKLRAIVHEADPEIVEEWKWRERLDGKVRRVIDIREGDKVDKAALKKLIRAAVALNLEGKSKPKARRGAGNAASPRRKARS